MTVLELYTKLKDLDNNTIVEISFKTTGYYSDDSDTHHVKVTEVYLNQARGTIVLE